MKVLLIDVNCKNSSTGKIVYDLYHKLREEGHQAAICYGRGDKITEPDIYKFGLDWETVLHAFLARVTGLNGCYSLFSTQRLIRYIDAFQPDVIHIHELHAYFVNIRLLLEHIAKRKIKVVWTFHCEYMYTGKCGHAYECEKWKTECSHCPALKEYPKSLLFDRTKHMYHQKKDLLASLDMTIVTPSKWLADRVKESFLKGKEVLVVHNGIDISTFCPVESKDLREQLGIAEEQKIVLCVVPNLSDANKGVKWVLTLCENMKQEDVSFVFVGEGLEFVSEGNKHFVGKITNQKELARYYSMADVLVICSKRETFPTTALEAQCCGTPVIGFDVGGAKETALEGQNNFVPYGNIDFLRGRIIRMFDNTTNKMALSNSAIKKYSKQKMVKEYIEIYSK